EIRKIWPERAWPCFSPDGRELAFTGLLDQPHNVLMIMPLDGEGEPRVVSPPQMAAKRPAWPSSGNEIAFNRDQLGIWTLDLTTHEVAPFLTEAPPDASTFFHPCAYPRRTGGGGRRVSRHGPGSGRRALQARPRRGPTPTATDQLPRGLRGSPRRQPGRGDGGLRRQCRAVRTGRQSVVDRPAGRTAASPGTGRAAPSPGPRAALVARREMDRVHLDPPRAQPHRADAQGHLDRERRRRPGLPPDRSRLRSPAAP